MQNSGRTKAEYWKERPKRMRMIIIRFTELQNQLITSRAMSRGYESKSAFIRDALLKEDYDMHKMIDEIYEAICKKKTI